MDRMQLIDALLPAIIAAGQSEHDGPQMLHSLSLGELKNMYEKQVASGRIKSETSAEEFVARRAQRAKSIEAEIQKELAERERVQEEAEDRVIRAEAEREADRLLFAWQRQQAQEPQRQAEAAAQQAKDWNTFVEAWRTLRSFSAVQANFHLIRQVLGPNFSVYQIKQALDSNAIQLAPPTQVELDF